MIGLAIERLVAQPLPAQLGGDHPFAHVRHGWLDIYLDARLARSGPVSNEFVLNYIAEHVLGLPTR